MSVVYRDESHLLRVGVGEKVDLVVDELLSVGAAHRLRHHLLHQLEPLHHAGGGQSSLCVVIPTLLNGLTQDREPRVVPPLLLQLGTNLPVDDKV